MGKNNLTPEENFNSIQHSKKILQQIATDKGKNLKSSGYIVSTSRWSPPPMVAKTIITIEFKFIWISMTLSNETLV